MIRLRRVGKRQHSSYRLIVSDKRKDTKGTYLEDLGSYDPHTNAAQLKAERIQYWISVGAQPSPTVHNLLVTQKLLSGPKRQAWRPKKKSGEATATAGQAGSGSAGKEKAEAPAAGKSEAPKPEAKAKQAA
ncbi:MAG: 30S ribosomal protein S16 [Candidatus Kerfeldbacteria bacterium]|nr:30S ribosomal protein S16 [Candidatus Kerfeldbacteria bacterium]